MVQESLCQTVTKNEIRYSLNKPDDFILAIVEFLDGETHRVRYVRSPFQRESDFGVTVNYDFDELAAKGRDPARSPRWPQGTGRLLGKCRTHTNAASTPGRYRTSICQRPPSASSSSNSCKARSRISRTRSTRR